MSLQFTGDNRLKIWVDGCFIVDIHKGGIGVWFNHNHPSNVAQSIYNLEGKSNNDVELMAVQKAMDVAGRPSIIYTDSQYVLDNMDSLTSNYATTVQRVDQSTEGIRQAHNLARQGAGIR